MDNRKKNKTIIYIKKEEEINKNTITKNTLPSRISVTAATVAVTLASASGNNQEISLTHTSAVPYILLSLIKLS